jgi:RNA polymerase sigma-70 factor (ECF subfamily)
MQQDHAQIKARLAETYEAHADGIFRYCRSKVKTVEEAEDIMQETFLNTWEYLCSGKEVIDLRTFLYRVAERISIDRYRKKKNLSLTEMEEAGFEVESEPLDSFSQSMEVEHLLLSAEKKQEYRLLVMRYVDGLRPIDIAQKTGLAPNTVSVRLHRALRKLTHTIVRQGES